MTNMALTALHSRPSEPQMILSSLSTTFKKAIETSFHDGSPSHDPHTLRAPPPMARHPTHDQVLYPRATAPCLGPPPRPNLLLLPALLFARPTTHARRLPRGRRPGAVRPRRQRQHTAVQRRRLASEAACAKARGRGHARRSRAAARCLGRVEARRRARRRPRGLRGGRAGVLGCARGAGRRAGRPGAGGGEGRHVFAWGWDTREYARASSSCVVCSWYNCCTAHDQPGVIRARTSYRRPRPGGHLPLRQVFSNCIPCSTARRAFWIRTYDLPRVPSF